MHRCSDTRQILWAPRCFCLFLSVTPPLSLGNRWKILQYKWIAGELFLNQCLCSSHPISPISPSILNILDPFPSIPVSSLSAGHFRFQKAKFNLFWTLLGVKTQKHRGRILHRLNVNSRYSNL